MTETSVTADPEQAQEPEGDEASLEVTDLQMVLGGRTVVNQVSLQLRPGKIVGLLGPNGAGKTTIFGMVMGIHQGPGRVVLKSSDGAARDITDLPTHRRARLGLGYLPQQPSAFVGLSVEANIQAVLQLNSRPAERAGELLETFGLTRVARQKARTLSGGERRRLEIARLLALDPRYVLLDEPFAGLDPGAVEDLKQILVNLKGQDRGVLITDHNVSQALTICDSAYILVDGHIEVSGTPGNGDIPWH